MFAAHTSERSGPAAQIRLRFEPILCLREPSLTCVLVNLMSLRRRLNRWLQGSQYHISRLNPALNREGKLLVDVNIEHFLAKELADSEHFFFVQIGANDGVRADDSYAFITRHRLEGIVVEPLKDMFEILRKNYSDQPQVTKINKAIHATAKAMTIYRIENDANVPDWCHGIASFDKNHLIGGAKKVPNLESYIIEESVDCVSLGELFEDNNTTQISFLQIDTEGYDFEIIKMIDFTQYRPRIIRYECSTLSEEDNRGCIELLFQQGYKFYDEGNDLIAILSD
ncbi:MAG: FkbM family methyltransferase [Sedimenticolaceae bacterium]